MRYSLTLLALAAAIEASPFPQAVTAKISPSGKAPPGCQRTYTGGTFGIAVMNISTETRAKRQVSTISDGQPQAPTSSEAVVSTISDGQPQAPTATAAPVSTISDGQPQAPTVTAVPVSTISDGQPQAPTHTMGKISQIHDGQIQGGMHTVTMMPVSQISDGQIQATKTYMAISTIVDGQPQAPTLPPTSTEVPVSTISDHQPQATTGTEAPVSTISDHQPQATTSGAAPASTSQASTMVACKGNSTLEITLSGGVLTDTAGRTGYIAANYQFQFDKPPQAGAIYTAGWSVCANGSLALGGSNVFYQCLSGDFYNLYNEDWAAQCSPVTIETLQLLNCS